MIKRRCPSARTASLAPLHDTPKPAAIRDMDRWSTTSARSAHATAPLRHGRSSRAAAQPETCLHARPARNHGTGNGAPSPAAWWGDGRRAHAPKNASPCPAAHPAPRDPDTTDPTRPPGTQRPPIRRKPLTSRDQPELIKTAKSSQVRLSKGSVRHVEVLQMVSVRPSIFGDLDTYPDTNPPMPVTPSIVKSQ